ncbi:PTS transporter subunit EIIC [Paratractidigestivibacter sp.]|uniref:PTS transporter subunit EIIC n=1 Tax=Paratractidigestivibacter sp. TaxID=2847316 RepID=UPI002ABD69AD|nr:PTS transporter subunit EIIC [Paratractidigestivibacter sp.]
MKYESLCNAVIQGVGGKENVVDVSHCVTRLRFHLKDASKADTEGLKATKGVLDVIQAGGQYQVVVGPQVEGIYSDLLQIGGFEAQAALDVNEDPGLTDEKTDPFSKFLGLVSSIFQPVLGVLMAGGFIVSIMSLICVFAPDFKATTTYAVLYAIGYSVFEFFPIIVAWSAGQRFGVKPVLSMAIGAVLIYPDLVTLQAGDPTGVLFEGNALLQANVYGDVFGIPLVLLSYYTQVLPSIPIIWFASKVQKFFSGILPELIRGIFTNVFTMLISCLVGLLVVGPITTILANAVAMGIQSFLALSPILAGFVVGTFWSLLVMFGLHWGIIPLWFTEMSAVGYSTLNPLNFAGCGAIMGACIGMVLKCKDRDANTSLNIPALISSFFGVAEPALYGILIPRKKLMWTTFIAAGIGGAVAGACGAKWFTPGANGWLGLPCYIDPVNGIDMGFIGLAVGGVIATLVAIAAVFVLGTKTDAEAKKEKAAA